MKKLHILILSASFLFGGCKVTAEPSTEYRIEKMVAGSVGIGAASLALAYMGKKINEIFKTETDTEKTFFFYDKGKSWSPGDCLLSASKITGRLAYVATWLTIIGLFIKPEETSTSKA